MRALALLLLLAAPAWGEAREPLDGAAFDALVTGRTLSYTNDGEDVPWGVERHFEDRRVTWYVPATGECWRGKWWAEGPASDPRICFAYDRSPGPHCFRYWREGDTVWSADLDGTDIDRSPLGADADLGLGCGLDLTS